MAKPPFGSKKIKSTTENESANFIKGDCDFLICMLLMIAKNATFFLIKI